MIFKRNRSAERIQRRLLGHDTVHIYTCRARGLDYVITQEIVSGRWMGSVKPSDGTGTRVYLCQRNVVTETPGPSTSFTTREAVEKACNDYRRRTLQ